LEKLYFTDNKVSVISELPKKLKVLKCNNNLIYKIDELPNTLVSLYCSNNKLSKLPNIPPSLTKLICHENDLPYDNIEEYWNWCKENNLEHYTKYLNYLAIDNFNI